MILTQIVNGAMTELVLCEECARKKGLFDPQSLTFSEKFFPEALKKRLDDIVRELTNDQETVPADETPSRDVLTHCPACGFALETFRKTGRLGCPDCYTVFARELENDLPAETEEDTPADDRRELEAQLRAAIEREDYETAAALRDRLRNLNPENRA